MNIAVTGPTREIAKLLIKQKTKMAQSHTTRDHCFLMVLLIGSAKVQETCCPDTFLL